MKSKKNLLEQLNSLPYFNKHSVYQLGLELGLKTSTVNTYISRFLKSKEIFQLKNALYVSTSFFEKNKNDISYQFYLANIIRQPSYVSSWAALQHYNLTTEAIYAVTCISPKTTRDYQTKAGNFSYQSINNDYFSNFYLVEEKFSFYIATPSKALFDLLYFRTNQFRGFNVEKIKILVEELRIDIDEMDESEQENFYLMIKEYLNE